jgi:hypothetical protein
MQDRAKQEKHDKIRAAGTVSVVDDRVDDRIEKPERPGVEVCTP